MRALIVAVVLVLLVGVSVPSQAAARAPESRKAWGCFLTVQVPGFFTYFDFVPQSPIYWSAAGRAANCDRRRFLVATVSVWQDVDGVPDHLIARGPTHLHLTPKGQREPERAPDGHFFQRWYPEVWAPLGALNCARYEAPVAGAPFYMRMVVKRRFHPGRIVLATRNIADPCDAPRYSPIQG